MLKRWPKRRELLLYYILYRVAEERGNPHLNRGEVVELLRPVMGSKRLAEEMARRLVRQGFLERLAPMQYGVRSPDELLTEAATRYIAGRLRRRGLDAHLENGVLYVEGLEGEECESLRKVVTALGLELRCRSYSSSSS